MSESESPKKKKATAKPKRWKFTDEEQSMLLAFLACRLVESELAEEKAKSMYHKSGDGQFRAAADFWATTQAALRHLISRVPQKQYHPKYIPEEG